MVGEIKIFILVWRVSLKIAINVIVFLTYVIVHNSKKPIKSWDTKVHCIHGKCHLDKLVHMLC